MLCAEETPPGLSASGLPESALTLRLSVLSRCSSAASHLFPYVKKRIQVVSQSSTELNPIEVAIDEMSKKVSELNQLCTMEEVDMIRLQLKLQGSVSVKVSAARAETHLALEPGTTRP